MTETPSNPSRTDHSFTAYLWADRYFWLAAVLCLGLQFYPETRWLLWPLRMLSTYMHELFHGLAALVSGGRFYEMMLFANGGGVAKIGTYGPLSSAFTSAGGLLGPAITGAIILFFARRLKLSRHLLRGIALLLFVSVVVWVRDWHTAFWAAGFILVLTSVSILPWTGLIRVFTQYLGLQLSLENLMDFDYMFTESFTRSGTLLKSDTGKIAEVLGGSYLFWATLIAAITLSVIALALIKSRPDVV